MSTKSKICTTGSKLQVFNGTAKHTSGGLKKEDLMKNKNGKVVSKKQHNAGMKTGASNLGAYLQTGRKTRSKTKQKGEGIFGDIGSAVDSVGSLLGLGLKKSRRKQKGGEATAYESTGGKVRRRKAGRKVKGGNILDTVLNGVGTVAKLSGLL